MMYYNPDTKEERAHAEVCAMYHTSFPADVDQIRGTWYRVYESDPPAPEDGHNVEPGAIRLIDGHYMRVWEQVPLTPEERQHAMYAAAMSVVNASVVATHIQTASFRPEEFTTLAQAGLFTDWAAGQTYAKGYLLTHDGIVYEVMQEVTAIENQPPDAEGMREIYRPLYTSIDNPEAPEPTLDETKARKLAQIDAETSSAILAGFTCEATPPDTNVPEPLHFSYDEFDQQNFSDAAVSMQLATAGGAIPTATPWNAYRNHTDTSKGDLVILQLTAETFVPIYAAALTHKATQMAIGGQRKAAVQAAQTAEEVEAI